MSDDDSKLSRRSFLRFAGAAGAAGVAAGCSTKPVTQKLYPYLTPPEDVIPGTGTYYRTLCRGCAAGCGVTAKTREGRVVKLEGNPEDPIGRGALCARGQAELQALYSPERLKGPLRRDASGRWLPVSWDDALQQIAEALGKAKEQNALAGVRFLTRPEPGSAGALQRDFLKGLGLETWQRTVLEPFDVAALRAAGERLFGRAEIPSFDLARAKTVVSFGADFFETWLSPVELTRGFSEGRGRVDAERTRLLWVGPRLSATAGSADEWLSVRAGGERAVALGVLRWLLDPANGVASLPPEAARLRPLVDGFTPEAVQRASGLAPDRLVRLSRELAQRRPSALLGPGPASTGADAEELAVAIQLVNAVLGNLGQTVLYGTDPLEDVASPFPEVRALLDAMAHGKVGVLFVHHADPVGALPDSLQAAQALGNVPLVVSFSDHFDATTQHAHLVLPDDHALESFGDVTARKGVVAFSQAAMRRLADTRAASQVLLDLAHKLSVPIQPAAQEFFEYVQSRLEARAKAEAGAGDVVAAQRTALQRGGYFTPGNPEAVGLNAASVKAFSSPGSPNGGELALVPFPTALRGDGRSAGLPWLREVPDVTSTVSWTAWAELSPATAARLEVETGDVLEVETPSGKAQLSAYVYPGLRDDAVAVPLGGPEALALVTARGPGLTWVGDYATVRRTGKKATLPQAEGMPEPHAGDVVKHVTPEAPALAPVPKPKGMYPAPEHPKHRWAMTIDLDRCTGCQACVVACYAENNVPVMGPEFAARGRNMAWLRIERYFEPEPSAGIDFLPMLCQQCTNAPCEPVCPVYATYHTQEGLNAQVYNRCVGTRYCSNNCPYKVRTFNYADPVFPAPLDLQLNPDVTVRSKGVMEKCTFCVQRIRAGENTAKNEGRRVRDGEIVPACAQTCPGEAIVFGDAEDPDSRVSRLRKEGRGFRALEDLNTQPAVTYLARVKGGKP